MKVSFKHDVAIDLKHKFPKGVHEIPEKLQKHWYIQALIKGGHADVVEEPKVAAPVEPPADESAEKPAKESKKKAGAKKDD